jgi:hypothetical protein
LQTSAAQDMHAVGVLLLNMLCTREPWRATERQSIKAVLDGTLYVRGTLPLATGRSHESLTQLLEIVWVLLHKDPAARLTAPQLLLRLKALVKQRKDSVDAARAEHNRLRVSPGSDAAAEFGAPITRSASLHATWQVWHAALCTALELVPGLAGPSQALAGQYLQGRTEQAPACTKLPDAPMEVQACSAHTTPQIATGRSSVDHINAALLSAWVDLGRLKTVDTGWHGSMWANMGTPLTAGLRRYQLRRQSAVTHNGKENCPHS